MAPRNHIDPYHARLHRLRRILTWMAAAVAGAVALAIPVIFFLTAYHYESSRTEQAAQDRAYELSAFIYEHPDLWRFNVPRLEKLLHPRSEDGRLYQMIGVDGEIIASSQPTPEEDAVQRSHGLSFEGVAPVFDGQNAVGTVHVFRNLWPILTATGWIMLLGFTLAVAIFVILRSLPLRALQERVAEMRENEHILQTQIADLEEAQRKLEMQGADLARLADDLLIARDEARAADRAKSEFLAAMSHELRTPLNAVIGFSEIIRDETFGPVGSVQYRDYASDIHESGQHLLGLINDILDLSKIESGTDELHEEKIEIPEIVRAALKLVGHRAEQGEVKLELELQDPLPALRADERKLKQILVNLLSNAIKFTDAGGEVALWAWCRMGSGHVFQIIDTGIGIAPENIPKALSRFGQVDADLNRQYEGTGLGLPLTKALVEQHGGILDLQSKVGVGTTATVRFPADRILASLDNADSLDVAARAAS
ncbi:MAG: HAMP domain-containing histidine kinase [Proteobacteria bacterium]|nr:HAMP domain-containing histidine kinase [Pseudomonadota bacterium]